MARSRPRFAMRLPALCRRSWFWTVCFLAWATVLWFLSDGPLPGPEGPKIPGLDKVFHFGYYFGGAGLLAAALFLRAGGQPRWALLITTVVLVIAGIGLLDEWHQSWIPERSGNDLGDWLADVSGGLVGALVFRKVHRVLT